jgi:hypothetical protein
MRRRARVRSCCTRATVADVDRNWPCGVTFRGGTYAHRECVEVQAWRVTRRVCWR